MKKTKNIRKRCSVKEVLHFFGMLIVPINVNKKTYFFLLDSGSQSNCISDTNSELLSEFKGNGETIVNYGIGHYCCTSDCGQLTYCIAGHSFVGDFSTISGKTFEVMNQMLGIEIAGLMGTPFMMMHNCIINFKKGIVSVEVSSHSVETEENAA